MYMRTKRIIAKCEQHSGYGAGAGDTEYYEYYDESDIPDDLEIEMEITTENSNENK